MEMWSGKQKRNTANARGDILLVGGKSEEAADLKKYPKMLQNPMSPLLLNLNVYHRGKPVYLTFSAELFEPFSFLIQLFF